MNSQRLPNQESTAVDDVRIVREKIAREHAGNLHEHIEQTNRIAEEIRVKLNVGLVPPPSQDAGRAEKKA